MRIPATGKAITDCWKTAELALRAHVKGVDGSESTGYVVRSETLDPPGTLTSRRIPPAGDQEPAFGYALVEIEPQQPRRHLAFGGQRFDDGSIKPKMIGPEVFSRIAEWN